MLMGSGKQRVSVDSRVDDSSLSAELFAVGALMMCLIIFLASGNRWAMMMFGGRKFGEGCFALEFRYF